MPGLKILDIGISTGGFSDYFLQHGAAAIFGVDVTITRSIRACARIPRLRLLKKNARFLKKEDVPFDPDLIVMDLSFISITAVLPVLAAFPSARILALVKPQFEAERGRVGKGGVVRDREERLAHPAAHEAAHREPGFRRPGLLPGRHERQKRQPGIFFPAAARENKFHW